MSKGLEAFEKIKKWHEIYEVEDIALYGSPEYATGEYEQEEELNAVEKELKAFDVIDSLFDFSTALRFPSNQPMLMITNKRTNEYWEIPLTQEEYDLLKEVLE